VAELSAGFPLPQQFVTPELPAIARYFGLHYDFSFFSSVSMSALLISSFAQAYLAVSKAGHISSSA
jgi:hypothetical protein